MTLSQHRCHSGIYLIKFLSSSRFFSFLLQHICYEWHFPDNSKRHLAGSQWLLSAHDGLGDKGLTETCYIKLSFRDLSDLFRNSIFFIRCGRFYPKYIFFYEAVRYLKIIQIDTPLLTRCNMLWKFVGHWCSVWT